MKKSFVSSKVELRPLKIGKGLVAKDSIAKGELVIDFQPGPGKYFPLQKANQLYDSGNDYMIQVDDNSFFGAENKSEIEEADYLNHSCSPSCGIKNSLQIVALRDISPGEEITIDYTMSESSDYNLLCKCGSTNCRRVITGDDWRRPDLQSRYYGYFSDYLQQKILGPI